MRDLEVEIPASLEVKKPENFRSISRLKAVIAALLMGTAGCASNNATREDAPPDTTNMTPLLKSKLKNDWKTILGADQRLLQTLLIIEQANQRYNRVDEVLTERIADQRKKIEVDQRNVQALEPNQTAARQ